MRTGPIEIGRERKARPHGIIGLVRACGQGKGVLWTGARDQPSGIVSFEGAIAGIAGLGGGTGEVGVERHGLRFPSYLRGAARPRLGG